MAKTMRTPEVGERFIESFTREGLGKALKSLSSGMTEDALDQYWKPYSDATRRRGLLELYRSGDFDKLIPYEGRLAALGLPSLIVWGGRDSFAGVELAHRFHSELPGSELAIMEDAGHFVWEDEPGETTRVVVEFLEPLRKSRKR
jgi:haloalkane dehalogenase